MGYKVERDGEEGGGMRDIKGLGNGWESEGGKRGPENRVDDYYVGVEDD